MESDARTETEILKGPNIRVTTEAVQVGNARTAIADICDIALVEADRRIRLAPQAAFGVGVAGGLAAFFFLGWINRAIGIVMLGLTIGLILYRDSITHQVNIRFGDGSSDTLYRTRRLADARIFHAAILKAIELRETANAEARAT